MSHQFDNKTRDLYNADLLKAKGELDAATNIKELLHALCREASLRQALNADVVPNLLYSGVHLAADRMVQRMHKLGWQQSVPFEQLGLRLVDCATLADLLHVIHLPLCNDSIPMPAADRVIAYKSVKRLQAALSSLDSNKLSIMRMEMDKMQEVRDDEQVFDNGQRYFIVYRKGDKNELTLAIAWDYEKDDYSLASRESFDRKSLAVAHATDLAQRHGKTFIDPDPGHDFLD